MKRKVLLAFLFCFLFVPLHADEGMWLPNRPPRELLKERYDFELTDAWLDNARQASVRFTSGGSGGFVSSNGLVVTNHHVAADALQKLSGKGKDLYRDGFHARTPQEELKCPDMELNVLVDIEDVTEQVRAAVEPGLSSTEAVAARKAVMAKLTKESQEKTGLRSDIVTLYRGGEYHLYRFKKYTDVRLVFSPELDVAFFGGDSDNYEYPRYCLDVAFFRVYENGQPAKTEHYFRWSKTGPREGDVVFVTGHPGTTNRIETLAHLKHRRDVSLPYLIQMLRQREALLIQFSEKSPEHRRRAQLDLFSVANNRKRYVGQHHGLLDPGILKTKAGVERDLRDPIETDPAKLKSYGDPWRRIAEVQQNLAEFEKLYYLLEKGDAFDSRLFRIARHLVRLAEELPKEDAQRLPEYRSSALESLKYQLFSPAPIHDDLEREKLTGSLAFLAENLGGEHPLVRLVLADRSPAQRAEELIAGTKLFDPGQRKRLFEAGPQAVADSQDPMIRFARLLDAEARKLRQRHDELEETQQQAYAGIARAMFDRYGASIAPDATFTLRLAFGVVKGYRVDGVELPYTTRFADAFARAEEQNHQEPFRLPKRWYDGKDRLDLTTPFNFVSTADTIGGNSGSPVLNRAGELVGINFDRNRHGLVRNFVYTDEQARHISVHSRAVLEALSKLYGAEALVQELTR